MKDGTVEMTGHGRKENQKQVSLFVHSPWKSPTTRFPHSHRPDDFLYQKFKERRPWRWGRCAPTSRLILR
jgi:hypothetical protein